MVKSAFALAGLAVLTFAAAANAQPNRRDYDRYFEVCDTGTQAQRLRCARNELSDSDRRLNIVYQRMLAAANRVDTRERRAGYRGWYSQANALRNAQRAWIAMRDSDCRFVTQPGRRTPPGVGIVDHAVPRRPHIAARRAVGRYARQPAGDVWLLGRAPHEESPPTTAGGLFHMWARSR